MKVDIGSLFTTIVAKISHWKSMQESSSSSSAARCKESNEQDSSEIPTSQEGNDITYHVCYSILAFSSLLCSLIKRRR